VRQRKAGLRRRVNGEVRIEFSESGLTSYAGLELLIRYFRRIGLNSIIRNHLGQAYLRGDYGYVSMLRLVLGLLIAGGRRLGHVSFLKGDSVFLRFCGLRRVPSERTVSRWLKNFKGPLLERFYILNSEIVARVVRILPLRTLTLDVDGTVISTGQKVERAFRGYNPHQRRVPSYYPITAHLAETGHIVRLRNRSGNVHDGKGSIGFFRDLLKQIEETLGAGYELRFRMDGAFFMAEILKMLKHRGAGYAIKVPFWRWLELKAIIRGCRRWKRVNGEVDCFEKRVRAEHWDMDLRVVIYRRRVHHRSPKNYQLDLFDPDDGYYEYSAVTTDLPLDPRRLWYFMCGRGGHEKVIGQIKSGLAFDTVPTNHYGANSAWQQIVTLAHNLLTNFQIETGARRRDRSLKHTCLFALKTVQTLRFEIFNRAGRIVKPNGTTTLRLSRNDVAKRTFLKMAYALAKIT
jgi:hypothetical protein